MGEGRIMHDYMDIGGRAKQDARAEEQLSRVTHGTVTEGAWAEAQLTTLNSVTSRHAESCISRSFGYISKTSIQRQSNLWSAKIIMIGHMANDQEWALSIMTGDIHCKTGANANPAASYV